MQIAKAITVHRNIQFVYSLNYCRATSTKAVKWSADYSHYNACNYTRHISDLVICLSCLLNY